MMSSISKFAGDTPRRPGPEYRAFMPKFWPTVRKNRMEQMDKVWLNIVALVEGEEAVIW